MKVSNPLTVIAIFSGLAETLATLTLAGLPSEIQSVFVYFVMAFPTLIVILFFLVLFFKNKALYAPSDFENQRHYLDANEIKQSISNEIEEVFAEINKGGIKLSRQEINNVKDSIGKKIDEKASLTRSDEILEYLESGAATTEKISRDLDIHPSYAMKLLRNLTQRGLIIRQEVPGSRAVQWSLST